MAHKVAATLALICLLLLIPGTKARADIAPPPPPASAGIFPGAETTQVRMVAETVIIDVASTAYDEPARASVKATFLMHNLGNQDETMQVRFPLNVLFPHYQSDLDECVYPLAGPEIQDFQAWVDGKPAPVQNTFVRLKEEFRNLPERDVKCRANFPVTFPARKDVIVEVRYSVEGYEGYNVKGLVEFPYVLVSGAGWLGTIGRAEIIYRAPFELTQQTLVEATPGEYEVDGRELRMLFEDFEPEYNAVITITNPGLWQRVEREQSSLAKDPNDGEAWGRLGRWYKEMVRLTRGWRWDAGGPELYALSRDAYTKAVTLKPKDADWHAGFADLLCWSVIFDHPGSSLEARDDLVRCVDEVRLALEINPNQALAKQWLDELSTQTGWGPGEAVVVDLSGARPVYTALTTTPTVRPTEIAIIIPSSTAAVTQPAAEELPAAITQPAAEELPAATETPAPTLTDTPALPEPSSTFTAAPPGEVQATEAVPSQKGGGSVCAAGSIPAAAAAVVVVLRRTRRDRADG